MNLSGQYKTSPCRDGEELEESSSNLTLTALGLEQEGNYSCAALNSIGIGEEGSYLLEVTGIT